MEKIKDWNRAFLFTGQSLKGEDIVKYAAQLREINPSTLETNVNVAEEASGLPIAGYLVKPDEIFNDNAALQMTVHSLNITAGDLALQKIGTLEGLVGAGHSLGEVAAMDKAGVFISRRASMDFVFRRGLFMQRAYEQNPGSLYLLMGLREANVVDLPSELGITPALFNGSELTVVAADKGKLGEIEEAAKKLGAKRVYDLGILPFHNPRMSSAQRDLEAYARQQEYQTTTFPVVSNWDGEAGTDGYEQIVKHITCVTQPVRWVDVIGTIRQNPDVIFYALGPSNNVAGLNAANGVPKEQTKDIFQLLAE